VGAGALNTTVARAALVAATFGALAGCAGSTARERTGTTAAAAVPAPADEPLVEVASFEHQVTGVTVAEDDRVFVNFPRWTEDSPVSVAEVLPDGGIRPYPDDEWNSWRNAKRDELTPGDHWVCVQSVVADGRGNLWVLDPAAPGNAFIVPGGPKLVRIDLATDRVAEAIALDETVAPQGSYPNDARFSPDGRHAYLTDSGTTGALVVVDLRTGDARRVLDGHTSTQPERGVVVTVDGEEVRRPGGRAPRFAADGIALSPDGEHLYWQALTGTTLYRVPTDALENPRLSPTALASRVERVGVNGVADGLLIDDRNRMYISALQENAVKVRDLGGGGGADEPTVLVQDERLSWPDTFAQGPDSAVYVTTSRIHESATYDPNASPSLPTSLWRIEAGE
jgi:sugar lactone lactonase YvrE